MMDQISIFVDKGEKQSPRLTRISSPVEVFARVTMALELSAQLLSGRAVRKRYMIIRNVVEEVDFVFRQH